VSDAHCPVQLHVETTYLIAASLKQQHFMISNCSYIRKKRTQDQWTNEGINELHWLGLQMGGCNGEHTCFDGSIPFHCLPCPSVDEIQRECPTAVKCQMNKCGGCQPQYYDQEGRRVCLSCPPGQKRVTCPQDLCLDARPPSTCAEANYMDLYCVEWSCGSCSTLWINHTGTEICKSHSVFHQCKDIALINFEHTSELCRYSYGFGMYNGKCSNIYGCSHIPLFQTMNECIKACTSKCEPDDLHCCDDGTVEDICVYRNLEMYCKYINCGDVKHTECIADPCNKCIVELQSKDEFNEITKIDSSRCQLELPMYLQCTNGSRVTCPSGLTPDCGSIPFECGSDWKARCVIDPCSCKSIWMNEDIRPLSDDCLHALMAKCVLEKDCPMEFECLLSAKPILHEHEIGIWDHQCIQEPCTCVPSWKKYKISVGPFVFPGFNAPCTSSDPNCCNAPDGGRYKPKNCLRLETYNALVCANITCVNQTIDRNKCETDQCNGCNIKIFNTSGHAVNLSTCYFQETQPEVCRFNKSIKCDSSKKANCGAWPKHCPEDWNLECVLDPCICKPLWRDSDARYTTETCKISMRPPCIPKKECPLLPCTPIDNQLVEEYSLVCVPHDCTCRPHYVPSKDYHLHHHNEGQSHYHIHKDHAFEGQSVQQHHSHGEKHHSHGEKHHSHGEKHQSHGEKHQSHGEKHHSHGGQP